MLVLNPLVFRAEFTGAGGPSAPDTYPTSASMDRAGSAAYLHLLPPFQEVTRDIVACN